MPGLVSFTKLSSDYLSVFSRLILKWNRHKLFIFIASIGVCLLIFLIKVFLFFICLSQG